jgi:DNA-directed RNA polymerase specialized sigma24 family protein
MSRPKRPKITKVLVDLALAGNRAAWVELVELIQCCIHWRVARTLLLARRTCPQDNFDVKQATLVALLLENNGKRVRSWNPSRGSFETYARLIAKQQAIAFLERFENESPEDVDVSEAKTNSDCSPEQLFSETELARKSLEILKSRQKSLKGPRLVDLLIVEQRATAEVCAIMNMTTSAVDQKRKRLQDQLEEIMNELGGGQ